MFYFIIIIILNQNHKINSDTMILIKNIIRGYKWYYINMKHKLGGHDSTNGTMRATFIHALRAEIRNPINTILLPLPTTAATSMPRVTAHPSLSITARHPHPRGLLRHPVGNAFINMHNILIRDPSQVLPPAHIRHNKRHLWVQAVVSAQSGLFDPSRKHGLLSALSETTPHSVYVCTSGRFSHGSSHSSVSYQLGRASYLHPKKRLAFYDRCRSLSFQLFYQLTQLYLIRIFNEITIIQFLFLIGFLFYRFFYKITK